MGRPSLVVGELCELMRRSGRHCWTLEELREGLVERGLAPDPSSVFRAVTRLERDGQVTRVPVDDRRSHYELTVSHHEHLVCNRCGRVDALDCSLVDWLDEQVQRSTGFAVTGHQLVLSGTCEHCRGGPGVAPTRAEPA